METDVQFDGLLLLVQSVGVPLLLTLAGLAVSGACRRRTPRLAAAVLVVAVLLAFVGGCAALSHEQWRFPPQQALDWLPPLALASLTVPLALEWRGAGARAWWLAQTPLAMAGVWPMLPPALTDQGWSGAAVPGAGLAALCLGGWWLLDGAGSRRRAVAALTLSAASLGLLVAMGGSIIIGASALSLAAALAVLWLGAGLRTPQPIPRAVVAGAAVLLTSIATAAYFYAEMSPWLIACSLACVPLSRWMRHSGGA